MLKSKYIALLLLGSSFIDIFVYLISGYNIFVYNLIFIVLYIIFGFVKI